MKMLIVDDSMVIRRFIQRTRIATQMEVILHAENGLDAIRKFKQLKPDIITMDLTMPQMDGIKCVQNLKALDPNISILVVSAMKDKTSALQAIKNGARGFLAKPFTEIQLNNALELIIKAKQKQHD